MMAKSRQAKDSITTAADRTAKSAVHPTTVTNGDVARRAYDLYLERGCEHGRDVEDWLQAERELRRSSGL
jgi:hypothetical protein